MINHYTKYKVPRKIRKSFVLQRTQADCGIACLLSVIRFYSGDSSLDILHRLSGCSQSGTTLLGLYTASSELGFDVQGVQINCNYLISQITSPVILHVHLNHYVVCYGCIKQIKKNKREATSTNLFIIGDPSKGIYCIEQNELEAIWITKKCLILRPNRSFEFKKNIKAKQQKWFADLVKPDLTKIITAVILGFAIAVLGLSTAIFLQKLVDSIIPARDYHKLFTGVLFVFLLLTAKELLNYFRQKLLFGQANDFNTRINELFYSRLLFMPQTFFDTRKIGELTARLNDTNKIQRFISQVAGNSATDFLGVFVSLVFIFIYTYSIGLICILITPLYYLLIRSFTQKIADGQKQIMKSYAITESNYINSLQGIDAIKTFNRENDFLLSSKIVYSKYQNNVFKIGILQSKLMSIVNFAAAVFLSTILLRTSLIVLGKEMTAGKLIAITGMCSTLLSSIANLALLSISFQEAKIAFTRMFEFTGNITEPNAIMQTAEKEFFSLRFKALAFRFRGCSRLLHNVSFRITKGELIAIVGENGSGKSTICQLIQKNYEYEQGDILINENISLTEINLTDWRKLYATVPQSIHIFNGTVLENIAFGDAAEQSGKVIDFLTQYGFMQFMERLPYSIYTIVGEEGTNLSGGQKQMIALARALYKKPQLLVLDEATAAMDRESEKFVLQLLTRLKKEMAVIFITHKLHILKSFCEGIYILENGIITAAGKHDDLLRTENLYSRYWADLV